MHVSRSRIDKYRAIKKKAGSRYSFIRALIRGGLAEVHSKYRTITFTGVAWLSN